MKNQDKDYRSHIGDIKQPFRWFADWQQYEAACADGTAPFYFGIRSRDKPASAMRDVTARPLFHANYSHGDNAMNLNATLNQTESAQQIADRCAAQWKSDAAIRAEFFSLESYTAFERAAAAGKVKIFGGNTAQRSR